MSLAGRHILIADDDGPLRRSLQRNLSVAGFQPVGTARNGHEALAYIGACGPDVVVLDIFMPEMDGFETLRVIKKEFPQIRIVIVSGEDTSGGFNALQLTTKLGADAVLQKPFTERQLIACITGEG